MTRDKGKKAASKVAESPHAPQPRPRATSKASQGLSKASKAHADQNSSHRRSNKAAAHSHSKAIETTYDAKAHDDIEAQIQKLQAIAKQHKELQVSAPPTTHRDVVSTPGPSRRRSRTRSPPPRDRTRSMSPTPHRHNQGALEINSRPRPGDTPRRELLQSPVHVSPVVHNFGSQANALAIAHTELAEMASDEDADMDEDSQEGDGVDQADDEFATDADAPDLTPAMFEELIQELRAAKSRRHRIKTTNTPADHLKGTSRRIICVHGPNFDYAAMATTGLSILALGQMDAKERDDRIAIVARFSDIKTVRDHLALFEDLCTTFPILGSLLPYLVKDKRVKTMQIHVIAKFIGHHAGAARSSHISSIRSSLYKYLRPATTAHGRVIEPLKLDECDAERNFGYHSLCTGRLRTPIDRVAEFDDDPERYCEIMNTPSSERALALAQARKTMPSFLFHEDIVGHYDADNPSNGAFKSRFLTDLYRHLLTGPSSANTAPGKTGKGRATLSRKWHLTVVVPEYLVYVASLVDFILSDEGAWKGCDPGGSKQALYNDMTTYVKGEYEDFMSAHDGDIEEEVGTPDENLFAWVNRWVYGTSFGDTYAVGDSFSSDPRIQSQIPDTRAAILKDVINVREARVKARESRRLQRERESSEMPASREPSVTAAARAPSPRAPSPIEYEDE